MRRFGVCGSSGAEVEQNVSFPWLSRLPRSQRRARRCPMSSGGEDSLFPREGREGRVDEERKQESEAERKEEIRVFYWKC